MEQGGGSGIQDDDLREIRMHDKSRYGTLTFTVGLVPENAASRLPQNFSLHQLRPHPPVEISVVEPSCGRDSSTAPKGAARDGRCTSCAVDQSLSEGSRDV